MPVFEVTGVWASCGLTIGRAFYVRRRSGERRRAARVARRIVEQRVDISDWLWVIAGAAVTLLLVAAATYWTVAEMRARGR